MERLTNCKNYNLTKKNWSSCFVSKSFSFLNPSTLFFFHDLYLLKSAVRKKVLFCSRAAKHTSAHFND